MIRACDWAASTRPRRRKCSAAGLLRGGHERPARDDDAGPGPDLRPRVLHLGRAAASPSRTSSSPGGTNVLDRPALATRGLGQTDRRLQRPHRCRWRRAPGPVGAPCARQRPTDLLGLRRRTGPAEAYPFQFPRGRGRRGPRARARPGPDRCASRRGVGTTRRSCTTAGCCTATTGRRGGLADDEVVEIVTQPDDAVAAVAGDGFRPRPSAATTLSDRLRFSAAGGVWVKGRLATSRGSHRPPPRMGVLLHLEVAERFGLRRPRADRTWRSPAAGNRGARRCGGGARGGPGAPVFVRSTPTPSCCNSCTRLGFRRGDLRAGAQRDRRPGARGLRAALDDGAVPSYLPGQ